MDTKNSYLYMITGKRNGKVELLIKTPTFIKITSLAIIKEQGVVGVFDINHILRLTILKYDDCWSFALGKFNSHVQIPREWFISIHDSHDNKCSTCLTLRTKSVVLIKPFTSVIIPEEVQMTEFEQLVEFIIKYQGLNVKVSSIDKDSLLVKDLGMDSLDIIEIIMELETKYDIEFKDEEYTDYDALTINNLFEVTHSNG